MENPWLYARSSGVDEMCYGSLDPKAMMRDMDARLGSVAGLRDTAETPKAAPKAGLLAAIWLAVLGWRRKDLRKV
jgi:hypothetical protein